MGQIWPYIRVSLLVIGGHVAAGVFDFLAQSGNASQAVLNSVVALSASESGVSETIHLLLQGCSSLSIAGVYGCHTKSRVDHTCYLMLEVTEEPQLHRRWIWLLGF